MLSRVASTLIILMTISACSTPPEIKVVPVIIPPKHYSGTVKQSEALQCPEEVRKSLFIHLKKRDQYIKMLTDVIKAHNEDVTE